MILSKKSIVPVNIFYWMPDYQDILQEFIWQTPDIKPEYPEQEPPEPVMGYHPDLIDGEKVSQRFNRLDPISAKSMPLTGNPHIDAKVIKARKKPK